MGAWGSSFTLSVMPLLQENSLPMLVETSSSPKITTSGNPWIFRISPTFKMEAEGFLTKLGEFNPPIKKAAFLAVNNDFGLAGTAAFKTALESKGVAIGPMETMASDSTDFSAQLENIKASGADTMFVTTAVEQLTLIEKQAAGLRLSVRTVGVGGSTEPDQLIQQAGKAANGTYLTLFFLPWFPDKTPHPQLAEQFVSEWKKGGYDFGGLTEGFRGYDGITTIAAAIREAGSTEPDKIRQAFWKVKVEGLNGNIAFAPEGPKGKESGQSTPNVYIVQIQDGRWSYSSSRPIRRTDLERGARAPHSDHRWLRAAIHSRQDIVPNTGRQGYRKDSWQSFSNTAPTRSSLAGPMRYWESDSR